jgi:hypothetical protein
MVEVHTKPSASQLAPQVQLVTARRWVTAEGVQTTGKQIASPGAQLPQGQLGSARNLLNASRLPSLARAICLDARGRPSSSLPSFPDIRRLLVGQFAGNWTR